MGPVRMNVPPGEPVTEYDRFCLPIYAALVSDADAGVDWRQSALTLLHIEEDNAEAEACWRSHLERARWIVGEGLAAALVAFSGRPGR